MPQQKEQKAKPAIRLKKKPNRFVEKLLTVLFKKIKLKWWILTAVLIVIFMLGFVAFNS